jgi:hypothetical protein
VSTAGLRLFALTFLLFVAVQQAIFLAAQFGNTEIGLTEGSPFRGRIANIAGTDFEPQYAWVPFLSQHDYDAAVSFYTGNDHRNYGLWYFGIPTLIADNQFSSPFFHVINSRLLSSPTQKHVRQLTTITRFEPRIFALLGVRFVITSRPLTGIHTEEHACRRPGASRGVESVPL